MPSTRLSSLTRVKRVLPLHAHDRRATLRDLYTAGLVSIFRRDSLLRLWEPLRETPPRRPSDDSAA